MIENGLLLAGLIQNHIHTMNRQDFLKYTRNITTKFKVIDLILSFGFSCTCPNEHPITKENMSFN